MRRDSPANWGGFLLIRAVLLAASVLPAVAQAQDAVTQSRPPVSAATVARGIERELNDRWDPVAARKLFETTGRLVFNAAQSKYFDSRISFYDGDYTKALALAIEASAEAEKLQASAGIDSDQIGEHKRFVEATLRATKNFQFRESEHFVIGFAPGRDELIADDALKALEGQYKALNAAIGTSFERKIRVEILPTGSAFVDASGIPRNAIETTNTIALCKYNKLLFTSPGATARGYDWKDTAAHELTHMFVFRRTSNGAPVWFQEGSAKYLENLWRGTRGGLSASQETLLAGALRRDKLVPIPKMHPSFAYLDSNRESALAFTQVSLILEYIVEDLGKGGFGVLNRIYDSMDKGAHYEQAIEFGTGRPWKEFFDQWLVYAKKRPLRVVSEAHVAQVRLVDPGQKLEPEDEDEDPDAETPKEVRNYVRLGDLLRARGHPLAARIEYAKALEKSPYSPVFVSKYSAASIDAGVTDGVNERIQKALEIYPEYVTLFQRQGDYHFVRKEWAAAEAAYLKALEFNPFHLPVRIRLVEVYDQLKKPEARDAQMRALELIKNS